MTPKKSARWILQTYPDTVLTVRYCKYATVYLSLRYYKPSIKWGTPIYGNLRSSLRYSDLLAPFPGLAAAVPRALEELNAMQVVIWSETTWVGKDGGFPSHGVITPVIHFRLGFSMEINQLFWGTPMTWETFSMKIIRLNREIDLK